MIAATSILASLPRAVPEAGAPRSRNRGNSGPFDLNKLLEGEGKTQLRETLLTGEEKEEPQELAALAGQGLEQLFLLHPQEAKVTAEGEAVAGILEGNHTSIGMDAEPLSPELSLIAPQSGTENEEILARMPQIIVTDDEMENSAARVMEDPLGGNLCPLENTDEAITVEVQPRETAAEPEALFAGPASAAPSREPQAETNTDTGQSQGEGASSSTPASTVPAGAAQISVAVPAASMSAAALASGGQPASGTDMVFETLPASIQRLEELMNAYDGGSKQVTIQLNPEHLGRLSISLTMGTEGLRAKIDTENPQTQAALSGEASRLLQKLGDSGIKVERMDILCSGGFQQEAPFADSGSSQSRQFGQKQQQFFVVSETAGNEGFGLYEVYTQTEETQSLSSVEYRA